MQKPNIVCVDDQREVLATLKKDLEEFVDFFKIEYCESAEEANELIEEIDGNGDHLALLICDHIMPVSNGIDFLIEVDKDIRFTKTKKLHLTGFAKQQDTTAFPLWENEVDKKGVLILLIFKTCKKGETETKKSSKP